MAEQSSRVRIGVLTRAFGLAGGIRCTLDAVAIPTVTAPCDAWTGYSETFLQPLKLLRCDRHGNELICYFEGITVKETADKYADRALFVPIEAIGYDEPFANPYLVGYEIRNEEGESLGKVGSIFRTQAHYIWSVELDGREWMLPAISPFIVEIRHAERSAIVRPIPGMVEEEPDDELE